MDILQSYDWPGNVRQLENEIERAAIICDIAGHIDTNHLSRELIINQGNTPGYDLPQGSLQEIIERVEHDVITASLRQHKGNIMQTSKALGLTRKGLKNKLARYRINIDSPGD